MIHDKNYPYLKDIYIAGDYLYFIENRCVRKLNLNCVISEENVENCPVNIGKVYRLFKTSDERVVALRDGKFELVK